MAWTLALDHSQKFVVMLIAAWLVNYNLQRTSTKVRSILLDYGWTAVYVNSTEGEKIP
jgi:hypothetical protein